MQQRAVAAAPAAAANLSPDALEELALAAAKSTELEAAQADLLQLLRDVRLPCARRLAYALQVATAALDAAQR